MSDTNQEEPHSEFVFVEHEPDQVAAEEEKDKEEDKVTATASLNVQGQTSVNPLTGDGQNYLQRDEEAQPPYSEQQQQSLGSLKPATESTGENKPDLADEDEEGSQGPQEGEEEGADGSDTQGTHDIQEGEGDGSDGEPQAVASDADPLLTQEDEELLQQHQEQLEEISKQHQATTRATDLLNKQVKDVNATVAQLERQKLLNKQEEFFDATGIARPEGAAGNAQKPVAGGGFLSLIVNRRFAIAFIVVFALSWQQVANMYSLIFGDEKKPCPGRVC